MLSSGGVLSACVASASLVRDRDRQIEDFQKSTCVAKPTESGRGVMERSIPGVGCRVDARGYISPQTKRSRSVQ